MQWCLAARSAAAVADVADVAVGGGGGCNGDRCGPVCLHRPTQSSSGTQLTNTNTHHYWHSYLQTSTASAIYSLPMPLLLLLVTSGGDDEWHTASDVPASIHIILTPSHTWQHSRALVSGVMSNCGMMPPPRNLILFSTSTNRWLDTWVFVTTVPDCLLLLIRCRVAVRQSIAATYSHWATRSRTDPTPRVHSLAQS